MKIAIEAQRIFRRNKHGMDMVVLEAIRELQRIDTKNEYYIYVSPGEDRCLHSSERVHIIELKCPSYPLWEQVALPLAVRKLKPDILHCTSNTAPLFCNVPLVLTLHDIIFLEKRQHSSNSLYQEMGWHYRRWNVPRILSKCKRIITVSKYECKRIREALHLPEKQIVPVYNGFSSRFKPLQETASITKKYIKNPSYLFFLGNTDPKKNVARTLKAYSIYRAKSSQKLPLLIADFSEKALDIILKQENIEHIKPHLSFPGYISHTDLPALYSGAFAFLYTSLRESFGIPMLEAMASGTPVLAANTSAMPEVAGEEALLANPMDVEDIAKKLLELENNPTLYEAQVRYGLERVKQFSWEQTARSMLSIYEQVYSSEQ